MIIKVSRTSTTTKDVSQIHLSNEYDILLTTFRPVKINQGETKEVVYQGKFINFKLPFQNNYFASNNKNFHNNHYVSNNTVFQHNYYASKNTHFPA